MAGTSTRKRRQDEVAVGDMTPSQQGPLYAIKDALDPGGQPRKEQRGSKDEWRYSDQENRWYVRPKGASTWLRQSDDGEKYEPVDSPPWGRDESTKSGSMLTGGSEPTAKRRDMAREDGERIAQRNTAAVAENQSKLYEIPEGRRGLVFDTAREQGLKQDASGNFVDPETGTKFTWNSRKKAFEPRGTNAGSLLTGGE